LRPRPAPPVAVQKTAGMEETSRQGRQEQLLKKLVTAFEAQLSESKASLFGKLEAQRTRGMLQQGFEASAAITIPQVLEVCALLDEWEELRDFISTAEAAKAQSSEFPELGEHPIPPNDKVRQIIIALSAYVSALTGRIPDWENAFLSPTSDTITTGRQARGYVYFLRHVLGWSIPGDIQVDIQRPVSKAFHLEGRLFDYEDEARPIRLAQFEGQSRQQTLEVYTSGLQLVPKGNPDQLFEPSDRVSTAHFVPERLRLILGVSPSEPGYNQDEILEPLQQLLNGQSGPVRVTFSEFPQGTLVETSEATVGPAGSSTTAVAVKDLIRWDRLSPGSWVALERPPAGGLRLTLTYFPHDLEQVPNARYLWLFWSVMYQLAHSVNHHGQSFSKAFQATFPEWNGYSGVSATIREEDLRRLLGMEPESELSEEQRALLEWSSEILHWIQIALSSNAGADVRRVPRLTVTVDDVMPYYPIAVEHKRAILGVPPPSEQAVRGFVSRFLDLMGWSGAGLEEVTAAERPQAAGMGKIQPLLQQVDTLAGPVYVSILPQTKMGDTPQTPDDLAAIQIAINGGGFQFAYAERRPTPEQRAAAWAEAMEAYKALAQWVEQGIWTSDTLQALPDDIRAAVETALHGLSPDAVRATVAGVSPEFSGPLDTIGGILQQLSDRQIAPQAAVPQIAENATILQAAAASLADRGDIPQVLRDTLVLEFTGAADALSMASGYAASDLNAKATRTAEAAYQRFRAVLQELASLERVTFYQYEKKTLIALKASPLSQREMTDLVHQITDKWVWWYEGEGARGTVAVLGPSVFDRLSPRDREKLRMLLTVGQQATLRLNSLFEVPVDGEGRERLLKELSYNERQGAKQWMIQPYGTPNDESLHLFRLGAEITHLPVSTSNIEVGHDFLSLLGLIDKNLCPMKYAPITPEQLHRLDAALDFLA